MIKKLLTSICLLASFQSFAQQATPPSWTQTFYRPDVPVVLMPDLDIDGLLAEDEIRHAQKVGPYKFGENIPVELGLANSGRWETDKKGNRLWRLGIRCMGAYTINLIFADLFIPKGASFYIYNDARTEVLGPYTYADVRADRGFATFPMAGELIYLEYFEPAVMAGQGSVVLETVTHGYRNLFDIVNRVGESGACNNNINCPEGQPWQNQKRSVAIMINGGSGFCTGAMVNNTAQDGTPYFLTANHCLGGSMNNWTFKFNYESPGCTNTGTPALGGGQFIQGATLKANNAGSDFGLLQLNSTPPANFNVYYSGWDNTTTVAPNVIAIHHPSGDNKKISFENNPVNAANWNGAACWHISAWDDGTTEPGSSGSPLFNPAQQIIGQLFGGEADCSNNVNDYYGRFAVSWNTGTTAATRLRDWLDPSNTGATTQDGWDPNQPTLAVDAGIGSLSGIANGATQCDDQVTLSYVLRNYGTDPLTTATIMWTIDATPQTPLDWTGSLNTNQTETINIPTQTLTAGPHTITIVVTNANGVVDQNAVNNQVSVSFTIVIGSQSTVNMTLDNYAEETSWDITDQGGNVVASGSGYNSNSTVAVPTCLADGCYTFTVYDEYGDGMCCQFGNGSFSLEDPNGAQIAAGGTFTDNISFDFCLPFVVAQPIAAFTSNATTICSAGTVNYTNQSTPTTGVSYAWTFENGTPATSTAQNPTVTYNTSGTFNVTLTVTNTAGNDVQTSNNYITVNPSPAVSSTSTPVDVTTGGSNGTVTATATGGTPPYTYDWNPGTGNTATVNGLNAGNYTVTITDDNGCTATSQTTVGSNVGINDLSWTNLVSVFPNPTTGLVTVEVPDYAGVEQITITDLTGRTLLTKSMNGRSRMQVDLSSLAEGLYQINLSTANVRVVRQVVHLH